MKKLVVLLLALLFVIPFMAGCGQGQQSEVDKKAVVAKQDNKIANTANTMGDEETTEPEESPKAVTALVTEPAPAVVVEAPAAVAEAPKTEAQKYSEETLVANFNSGEKTSNLGGTFGAWNKDPSDPTQWCKEGFDNVTRHGDTGFAMRLDYSVDSPNPAYNGFWMTLPNFDATKYDALNLWVKGDSKAGFTTVFKIELKNASKQAGHYYVSNVSDQWQEISVPLAEFKGLIDRTSLTELVLVFEDRMATNKKGIIYVDDIRFVKK